MSNTCLVRVQKPKCGQAYVAFERRQYISQELPGLVGQTLTVRKCQASSNIITAISPDGTSEFQLHARRSSPSTAKQNAPISPASDAPR